MFEKLAKLKERYGEVCSEMNRPETVGNQTLFRELAKEQADLQPKIEAYNTWLRLGDELNETKGLLDDGDPDMATMAQEELKRIESERSEVERQLTELLTPKNPDAGKNLFLEIRAGTGGDEAGLFAADLSRMYIRFAERSGWKSEIVSGSDTGVGGYREVILFIRGEDAFMKLRHESGVHRVQRVPDTETQGRIHTSAVTVAVLPEAEDVDVDIKDDDLRIDVFRSSGPGGQSVNTTDSAVRITHIPTGVVVSCQDEKSQHKNKAKAMKILKARILDAERQRIEDERSEHRRSQVGSGDRSEKIRTYNFPQSRITDHRIQFTTHRLSDFLDGALDEMVDKLHDAAETQAVSGESE